MVPKSLFSTFRTLTEPYNKSNFLLSEIWNSCHNTLRWIRYSTRTWVNIKAYRGTVGDLPFPKGGNGWNEFLSLSLQVFVLFACWAAQLSKGLPWDMTGLDLEGAGHWIALVILASHSYAADSSFGGESVDIFQGDGSFVPLAASCCNRLSPLSSSPTGFKPGEKSGAFVRIERKGWIIIPCLCSRRRALYYKVGFSYWNGLVYNSSDL